MTCEDKRGSGLRRYDAAASEADRIANQFVGLEADFGPGHILAGFKMAAPYLGYPRSVIHLIDALFAWTKADDWRAGQTPVVWPRNELLSQKLGVGIRQTQNLLDRAVELGLITHKDSPNGHRGGQRDTRGRIKWAYGIVLSPLGYRYPEFVRAAAAGRAEDITVKRLRVRLASARRKVRTIAEALVERPDLRVSAIEDLALAQMAATQMRGSRNIELLANCVEQLETRTALLERAFNASLQSADPLNRAAITVDTSCSHDSDCAHSTTTIELQSAFAEYSSSLAKKGSGRYDVRDPQAQTATETDLEKHRIDPEFIGAACPELCWDLDAGRRTWGDVISIAERLVDRSSIHRQAWSEACRLMGDKGAATAVIVTVHKFNAGIVLRPGAYLRGMNERALTGTLHLGKTMRGLKELRAASHALPAHSDPRAIARLVAQKLTVNP